jgi:hypothetical protein
MKMDKIALPTSNAGVQHPTVPALTIPLAVAVDRQGLPINGSGGAHVLGRNAAGQIITDTWTYNGAVFVKTYTRENGVLTGWSDWVKQ